MKCSFHTNKFWACGYGAGLVWYFFYESRWPVECFFQVPPLQWWKGAKLFRIWESEWGWRVFSILLLSQIFKCKSPTVLQNQTGDSHFSHILPYRSSARYRQNVKLISVHSRYLCGFQQKSNMPLAWYILCYFRILRHWRAANVEITQKTASTTWLAVNR